MRFGPLYLIFLVIIFVLIFAHVWQQIQIISLGYQIAGLKDEKDLLQQINSRAKADLARLRSLARIEAIAKHRLGLLGPESTRTILLPSLDSGDLKIVDRSRIKGGKESS
ncbi:MAG: septum formation initiator family protein [bacterium]